ncbi:hypothetical protein DFS33DRAFT_14483 [Desarmillaria ectypa]|nr:hypothetical protein DFS33DRAFT_14483 [Desarmillaria ectypa]
MEYRELSFAHRRNVVACMSLVMHLNEALTRPSDILCTISTMAAHIFHLFASLCLSSLYTLNHIGEMCITGLIVSGLYLYELVCRSNMRQTLFVHHFCTLFAIIFIQIALQMALSNRISGANLAISGNNGAVNFYQTHTVLFMVREGYRSTCIEVCRCAVLHFQNWIRCLSGVTVGRQTRKVPPSH